MDPIAQIFAQSQAGSAGGEGFGQFFAEGVRQAQQQQGLNLSRRRLEFEEEREKRREPMLELERVQALQRLALGSLELQKTQSDNSYAISLRNADLEISKFMSALAQSGKWGSPESWQAWNQITSRVPLAAVSKSGQLFLQQQRLAMANQRLAEQYGGRPTKVEIKTPEGADVTFGSAGGVDPIIERKLQLLRGAVARGDKTAIQAYESDLKLNALRPESKALYEAEIQALDRDLKMATKPEEYLNRRMDIVRKYFNPAASSTPPAGKLFRPNFKTGRLEPVP